MAETEDTSGVLITEVRVSNFRSLQNVSVKLSDITVLVGANNAGKTSLLDAIYSAMGASRKNLSYEDIYLAPGESLPSKDKKAVIDILVKPAENGTLTETFPAGSFWTDLWGNAISQDEDEYNDFLAFRTTLEWSPAHGEYVLTKKYLKEWLPFETWLEAEEKGAVRFAEIEPIALNYIDAKRDLEDDLKKPGSFWRRLTSDLGLEDQAINDFEIALNKLNEDLINGSSVLTHLKSNLTELQSVVAAEPGGVDISPVARRLQELSKGIDVTFSSRGGQPFALSRHGMGTRSLASLMVFKAYVSWREKVATANHGLIHSTLALEEPEAHLHPQAQRSLYNQIVSIPGQRIVSTHSPYIAGQADIQDLRLFKKNGPVTDIKSLDLSPLSNDDIRKINREVMASHGDLLFANAIILFEGETEEQAFPIFYQQFMKISIDSLGLAFIGVGGPNYYPFIWLAKNLDIPWFIFSDGEPGPRADLNRQLRKAGESISPGNPNVTVVPNDNGLEEMLLSDGYQAEIEKGYCEYKGKPTAVDDFINTFHGTNGKGGVIRNYNGTNGREKAVLDIMKQNKTQLATHIADNIIQHTQDDKKVPPLVKSFFENINQKLSIFTAPEGEQ